MIKLVEKQEKLLRSLETLLKEEKEVLVREDGKRLIELVSLKQKLYEGLKQVESDRKKKWKNATLMEAARSMDEKSGKRLIEKGKEISRIYKKIKELQETNMMLTRQSEAYGRRLMDILQNAVRSSSITYGQNGSAARGIGVMASVDRSV